MSTGLESVVKEAAAAGMGTVQIFSRNPVGGQSRGYPPRNVCRRILEEANIRPLFVHAPYFVNPAATEMEKSARARRVLFEEMRRIHQLAGDYLVLHPGHRQSSDPHDAVASFAATVRTLLDAPGGVLVENAAGQGREQGETFEQLAEMLALIEHRDRVGVMLDTAHAIAAGFPLVSADDARSLFAHIDATVGLRWVRALHLNDNAFGVGSRRDRHAHLLEGFMGRSALGVIVRAACAHQWPIILETPGRDLPSRRDDVRLIRECMA